MPSTDIKDYYRRAWGLGDRVGLKDGKGIISQTGIPYYADKALEGIVHSAETLSKLPFAGGKLISDLLRQKPTKKMFTEALEEIQPGSWSSKIGLNDLIAKEEKNLPQSIKNVGNVLGLGTEIAVPVGAALKVGNTILKNVSKSFGKSKKGKTLEQVVDKQLTAFGQSRRDFNIVAGTSGLMVALKAIGLGGLATKAAKLGDDIKVTLKSDADYSYEGPESGWEGGTWTNVSFEPLTKVGIKILDSLVKSKQMIKDKVGGYISNTSEDAAMAVEKIKNKNGKMQVETTVGEKTKGAVKGEYESTKIYSGKDIDSRKILHETSELATDSPYHDNVFHDEFTEDIINIISPKKVKKAEGGRIGAAEGRFLDSVGIGPLSINPRAAITESEITEPYQGTGPQIDKKTGTVNIGADIMLDLPKDFYLKGEYDQGRASEDIYYQGEKVLEDVPFDHDIWKYGVGIEKEGFRAEVIYNPENERYEFKLVKSFNDGGKVWRPKSAPKLTTTIPPERGPTPHGLTYLTGDDIVKHRIG